VLETDESPVVYMSKRF